MTFQQLHYFQAVAHHLNFGMAARACFISQPSLSHGIADLEKELGVQLLDRTNRSVKLTQAGVAFLQDTTKIMNDMDAAVFRAKHAAGGAVGTISIGYLQDFGERYLPDLLTSFHAEYPDVSIRLSQYAPNELRSKLLREELDLLLTGYLDISSHLDEISWCELSREKFCIAINAQDPILKSDQIDYDELKTRPFITCDPLVSPLQYNNILKICNSLGFSPTIAYTAPSLSLTCTYIKCGLGISILPERASVYKGDQMHMIPIDTEGRYSVSGFAWLTRSTNPIIPLLLNAAGLEVNY